MKIKLGTKINLIVIAIIVLLSAAIGFVINQEITKGIKEFATEKAKGDLRLAYRYVDNKYSGDWEVRDNKLFKGTTIINDNEQVVDKIGKDTGDTVTIFLGDTRIATNVMVNGKRAIGTQASAEVVNKVLKNGAYYYGEANVAGNIYQTAYMPLKSSSGQVIGIMYVGASQEIINHIVSSVLTKFLIVLIIMIVLASAAVYGFTQKMKKRLTNLTHALEMAGSGDFTTKVSDKSTDELGTLSKSYNQMSERLKTMMNEVVFTSEQLAASSEQLTASSEQTSIATETITESILQVAGGAEQSTTSVQESAQALEEVTKGVQSIADSALVVSEVSMQAAEKAKEGGLFVDNTVNKINDINLSVIASGEVIKTLGHRSREIENISNVITDIANQTNLLALNAAIEAARAGEHGKGFAVVADEVRKLAEQSQQSSSQISALIKTIQEDMSRSNQSIEQVSLDVSEGLAVVNQTKDNFHEILDFMEKLTGQTNDMAATSEQISVSTQGVSKTVSGIINISGQTSMHSQTVAASAEEQLASMEEIAASASALSNLAEDLKGLISKFKV
ncbi:methyl-accepting chemotaxis protein [Peribacillus kribbensis]|uniref:methyl-accepting chemotaxis protein n=1 Tax=Peribacillus kribbensis TaxID=356658 RepID=UPI0004243DD3|nr:methyl-accepting chemotaxis protein [Peribacillus kribbensis]